MAIIGRCPEVTTGQLAVVAGRSHSEPLNSRSRERTGNGVSTNFLNHYAANGDVLDGEAAAIVPHVLDGCRNSSRAKKLAPG